MTDSRYRIAELNNGIFAVQERGCPISGPEPIVYSWTTINGFQGLEQARAFVNELKEKERYEAEIIEANKVKRVIE